MRYIIAFAVLLLAGFSFFYFLRRSVTEEQKELVPIVAPAEKQDTVIQDTDTITPRSTDTLWPISADTFRPAKNSAGFYLLNWNLLTRMKFNDKYNAEVGTYIPYPVFHPSVKRLSGQKVEVSGYVIPLEETGDENILVLSAYPYSSCFFCGAAGPESVMDIKLKVKAKRRFTIDERLTFRGTLNLNDSDLYYLNYILEEAEVK